MAPFLIVDFDFDVTVVHGSKVVGLTGIQRYMETEAQHPRTHLMTNIYVDETPDGVKMYFRLVALLKGERQVGTASYFDDVVKTAAGWRFKDRVITRRRRLG